MDLQIGNLEKNQSGTHNKPTYTFEDKETGEVFDKLMKISEKEQYLKDNPNLKPVLTAPNFVGDHIVKKMDGGMKEVFSKITDAHPNTPTLLIDLVGNL